MKNKSTIVFLISLAIIVAGVVVYGLAVEDKNSDADTDSSDAEMSITPASHNFGKVSQKEGVVNTSFTIENTGSSDLVIDNMVSSCGCTSAALVVDGEEGPKFGMHNNPKNWSVTIKPDDSAELKVYYDPDVHEDFRGRATREITLFSNDKNNSEKKVKISVNQVD